MKITLIRPNIGCLKQNRFADEARMELLALGKLAGMTLSDNEGVSHV